MLKKLILLLALILLTTANVEAAEENDLPFEPLAATYTEGGKELLALIKMKENGSIGFMVMAKDVEPVGLIAYSKEVYDFYLNKDTAGGYPPLITMMIVPNQERGQVDDDLGEWNQKFHLLPIYALFKVENGKVVCEKPFYSASGLNPSHYHGTIRNINHTRLIEIFMTHMPQLHEVVQAQGITLP